MGTELQKEQEEKLFQKYCETLRFLSESTDDTLGLFRFCGKQFYFFGDFAERFPLERKQGEGYSAQELVPIVFGADAALLEEDLRRVADGEQDSHDMVYRLMNRDGNPIWVSSRGRVLTDEDGNRLYMMGRLSESALAGKTDSMTGLLNEVKFHEDFAQAVAGGAKGTLLVLGADDLKRINVRYGRAGGNRILAQVSRVLEMCVEDRFRVYRLGGDLFAVNFTGYTQDMVYDVYENFKMQMGDNCTFSAGAVSYPLTDVGDAETIYQYAESALERAKKTGKNRLEFFSVEDYMKQLYLLDLAGEIRRSVRNGFEGFFLCYQPQIAARTMTLKGAEALLRYRSAYHGVILPEVFLPILEHGGMMPAVGEWVLREALRRCSEWRKYDPGFCMSINLSYHQLRQKEFTNILYGLLDQFQLPGEAIILEVKESMQLQDFARFNKLFYQWSLHGIQIAIDDFGTDYAGLSYLKNLAIDEIKLGRNIIANIHQNAYHYRLLQNVAQQAHAVQIRVSFECIETKEEYQTLRELQPQVVQGHLFARALTDTVFEERFFADGKGSYQFKLELSKTGAASGAAENNRTGAEAPGAAGAAAAGYVPGAANNAQNVRTVSPDDKKRQEAYEQDELILRCLTDIAGRNDLKYCMEHFLQVIGGYYHAERSYLFLYSEKDETWCNLYEWCQNDVRSQQIELLSLPQQEIGALITALAKGESLVIPDIDSYRENEPNLWKTLSMQNIRRVIEVPLLCEGRLFAFAGVDNPKKDPYDASFFARMAPFLTGQLLQKDMVTVQKGLLAEMSDAIKEINIIKDLQIGMWIVESDVNMKERRMYADKKMLELLGENADTVKSGPQEYEYWYGHIAEESRKTVGEAVREMKSSGRIVEAEYFWQHPALGKVPVRAMGRMSRSADGITTYKGLHIMTNDLLTKQSAEGASIRHQYERREDFYRSILLGTSAYLEAELKSGQIISAGGLWEAYLPQITEKNGHYDDLLETYAADSVADEDRRQFCQHVSAGYLQDCYRERKPAFSYQFRCRTPEGHHWLELFTHVLRDPELDRIYALFYVKDIHEEKMQNLENERAATRDPLTGVFNRKAFEEHAIRYMREDARDRESCALLILDIDNFKNYNDTIGHQGGDEIIRAFTQILSETFRKTDYVGRFGGDEFVVFQKNFVSREILDQRIVKLIEKLNNHEPEAIFCSIGIAVAKKEDFDYEICLSKADEALYESKNSGKNRFAYRMISEI